MNDERRWEGHSRLKRPGAIVAPLLVTALGAGWLLTAQGFIPGVQWAWVLALAALGALVVTVKGPDKFSFVIGPLLMVTALLSFLRQTGRLGLDTEIPLLTITRGGLWTTAHVSTLPLPSWFISEPRIAGRASNRD